MCREVLSLKKDKLVSNNITQSSTMVRVSVWSRLERFIQKEEVQNCCKLVKEISCNSLQL